MLLGSNARFDGVRVEGALETLLYVASGSHLSASHCKLRGAPVGLTIEEGSIASEKGFKFVDVTRPSMALKR